MLINANISSIARECTIYLNGQKELNAVEVYIPGNVLEGRGYVVRQVTQNGRPIATIDLTEPLHPGQYDYQHSLCEKVFGDIRIEIAECFTEFEDN